MSAFGISGLGSGISFDFATALNRKYNILQQQADASTKQADAQMIGVEAAAQLDRTKANLLPGETKANIAKTIADAGLTREQTKFLGPETEARIANLKANTGLTTTQDKIAAREGLTERNINPKFLRQYATPLQPFGDYVSDAMSNPSAYSGMGWLR